MMTSNIFQCHGLLNGSTKVVCGIIYKYDEFFPELTTYVWVNFNGKYKGPKYLTNKESLCGWVPLHTTMTIWWTQENKTHG